MALRGKMQEYAEARAQGLDPRDAATQAGYSPTGLAVTVSRLEKRADIQAEIHRQQGGHVTSESEELGTPEWKMKDHYDSPLALMLDVMNNPAAPRGLRYTAAKDAMPYCHARKEGGKREEADKRGKQAAAKFPTQGRPSHLRSVG